jgi:quinol monooxygenase YgiN
MNKYLYHSKLSAKKDQGETLRAILLKASQAVESAKGCQLYVISKDKTDTDCVWVTEIWENKEDHDNSLKLEHVKAIIMQAMPFLEGQPQKGQELEVLGGLGV